MTSVTFRSNGLILHGQLNLPPQFYFGALFLHGGGRASSSRYKVFQKLQNAFSGNIASLAFDFRGCGQSQGKFKQGSLTNRLKDADAALHYFVLKSKLPKSNIYVWGSSMGGHIACRLLETHPNLKGVILQSAAAYSQEAEALPLNDQFTQAISQPNSWQHSPAFTALEQFNGKIMVVYGEHDVVVPRGIQAQYQAIARQKKGQVLILKHGTHSLLHPQDEIQEKVLDQLLKASCQFILN